MRVLGVTYLIAFLSFGVQILGLIGKNGILPLQDLLQAASAQLGPERYWAFPTLFWFNASDRVLQFLPVAGAVLSMALIGGFAQVPALFLLWLFYLSLVTSGQDFMAFQWDNLLLETGFLAIFLAPLGILPASDRNSSPPKFTVWLCRWLLFRLMFSSGVVKLASGDETWRALTALNFHYETQPLPTQLAWYFHQAPAWFQKFSVLVTFLVELGFPFLIFGPRLVRLFACGALVSFQLLIALTGNYCFFNLLAIALCLFLIEDADWPGRGCGQAAEIPVADSRGMRRWPIWVIAPIAGLILMVSGMQMVRLFRVRVNWFPPFVGLYQVVAPFRTVNSYGLFAVMTTARSEIVIEGSKDGVAWLAYEFKWKPGDLKRRPRFVAPHQPRLDWQMWFAVLGNYRENPWFMNFLVRLLEGSTDVLSLMKSNPFPESPPRFIRAVVYDYHFTDPATRRSHGTWWRREKRGLYCPVASLREA